MMLKELKKCLKSEIGDKEIFDIVLYGSSVKGKRKPGDLDIAVFFKSGNLRDRLNKLQEIKHKINLEGLDIKGFLLEDLFKPEFFGRSGIFLEGISILDEKKFANKIGFETAVVYVYNMKDKTHTEKVKFNYLLSGRNSKGVLKILKGEHLAPGVIEVPVESSIDFEEILTNNKISFSKKEILKRI